MWREVDALEKISNFGATDNMYNTLDDFSGNPTTSPL